MIDFGSATKIIDETDKQLQKLRTDENAWSELEKEIRRITSDLGIKEKKKQIMYRKRFFDENNIDVHAEPDTLTKLKREAYFEVIDALRLQINDRFQKDTLDVMKELSIFCHENLLKADHTTRADNLCQHCNLDPELVEKELSEFKPLYKAMETDIDVSDLPGCNLQVKPHEAEGPEGQNEENNASSEEEDMEEVSEEERQRKRKRRADIFILKGFIKPFRLLMQLSAFSHLTVSIEYWSP